MPSTSSIDLPNPGTDCAAQGPSNCEDKTVWELSLDEIEYLYRYRHMNHYVYAALQTCHTSSPPLDRVVTLRRGTIPSYLDAFIEKLLEFSPLIGHEDPSYVRAGITFYTYNLYAVLYQVPLDELPTVTELLSACAYLSLLSEKHDHVPLWVDNAVRPKNTYIPFVVKALSGPQVDMDAIAAVWFSDPRTKAEIISDTYGRLFHFMQGTMTCLIGLMEHGDDAHFIEQALLTTEQTMSTYEREHGLADPDSPIGLRDREHIEYRNTLYLYGGMFFEKQGQYERAIEWYLKDIYDERLSECFCDSYKRAFKTIERLMSAYRIVTEAEVQERLRRLIDHCLVEAFRITSASVRTLLEYVSAHPTIDITSKVIETENGKIVHFAGPANREGYLIALLYHKFMLGKDYRDIDYSRFFRY